MNYTISNECFCQSFFKTKNLSSIGFVFICQVLSKPSYLCCSKIVETLGQGDTCIGFYRKCASLHQTGHLSNNVDMIYLTVFKAGSSLQLCHDRTVSQGQVGKMLLNREKHSNGQKSCVPNISE